MVRQILTLLCTIFLTFCIHWSEPCTCGPSHPQEKFCNSDFVILARIKQSQVFNITTVYKARIRKEFKMSEKAEVALKSGRLLTPTASSMCGSDLIPGKLYVLGGRVVHLKATIYLCDMAERWENLSRRQRKGLKKMYRQGCTCKICSGSSCTKGTSACFYPKHPKSTRDCYDKEGICLPSQSKVCRWGKSAILNKCASKLTISRLSG